MIVGLIAYSVALSIYTYQQWFHLNEPIAY